MHEKTIRLTVNEASKMFGIGTKTIRRGMKRQELRYLVIRGRYKISFVSLLTWALSRTKIRNKLHEFGIGQFVHQWKINDVVMESGAKTRLRKRGRPRKRPHSHDTLSIG